MYLAKQIFKTLKGFMLITSQFAVSSGVIFMTEVVQIMGLVTNTGFVCLFSDTVCGTLL